MMNNSDLSEFELWILGCKKTNLPIIPVEVPGSARRGTGVWETHSLENHNNPYAHPVYHVYVDGEHLASVQCLSSAMAAYRNALKKADVKGEIK